MMCGIGAAGTVAFVGTYITVFIVVFSVSVLVKFVRAYYIVFVKPRREMSRADHPTPDVGVIDLRD